MYKDIRAMIINELKHLGMDCVEKGIHEGKRYDLYQSYDLVEYCTLGILVQPDMIRVVLYDNFYELTEDAVIFRDIFRYDYMSELLYYGNSVSTIISEVVNMMYEERDAYYESFQTGEE